MTVSDAGYRGRRRFRVVTDRFGGPRVLVDEALLGRLRDCCDDVSVDDDDLHRSRT